MVERLLISGVIMFLSDARAQLAVALIVFVIFLSLQQSFAPYSSFWDNSVANVLHVQLVLIMCVRRALPPRYRRAAC